jgi:S1-C subfamily serine protease
MSRSLLAVVLVVLAGISSGCAGDGDEAAPAKRAATETPSYANTGDPWALIPAVVREVQPSVVSIVAEVGGNEALGSGVIWDEDTIVTNAHVVAGSQQVEVVLASGDRIAAQVAASSSDFDVAVLRVDRDGLPPAEFADALPVVGELAVAIGIPSGSRTP